MKYKKRKHIINHFLGNTENYLKEYYFPSGDNFRIIELKSQLRSHPFYLRSKVPEVVVGDIDIFDEVVVRDSYNTKELNFEHSINVLDIGANIGTFSWLILMNFDIENLICIEPDLETYTLLLQNIKSENSENIFYFNGACGIDDKDLYYRNAWNVGGGRILEQPPNNETLGVKVKVIDINNVSEQLGITRYDIVKIDTEGCEIKILKKLISCNLLIKNFLLETHTLEDFNEVVLLLEKYGHSKVKVLSEISNTEGHFKVIHSSI